MDKKHFEILAFGVEEWNAWRKKEPAITPDLVAAKLRDRDLGGIDFTGTKLSIADLRGVNLQGAKLESAELGSAHLDGACLSGANLRFANLANAEMPGAQLDRASLSAALMWASVLKHVNLAGARLIHTNLVEADLRHAVLRHAILEGAILVGANLEHADLTEAQVHGVAAWNVKTNSGTRQSNLRITSVDEPEITVDKLEVAQFVYLLLKNEKIRDVIDTMTSKVVLILGRFTAGRKAVLDALREELRHRDLVPVLFDFDGPKSKDVTGTVEMLARMARFVIADLTDSSSVPHELATIVPFLRSTPVLPLRLAGGSGYGMFNDLRVYPWVLAIHEYASVNSLLSSLASLITLACEMAERLRRGPT
jgi:uncharacterized protein YjbI with pentapeptide repeats